MFPFAQFRSLPFSHLILKIAFVQKLEQEVPLVKPQQLGSHKVQDAKIKVVIPK